jgi:hypothetical protein
LSASLQEAVKKAEVAVAKIKVSSGPSIARKTLWFEKFDWFISSEGYVGNVSLSSSLKLGIHT